MSFEWQTEEDYSWDEEPAVPGPSPPKRRRWPWVLLLVVLLVGTAVFLIVRQLNQRIEVATGDVEADLIASYAVLQQAAEDNDQNLFNSLLSGRDRDWSLAQQANLATGLLFDRPGFNLAWQPGLVETAVLTHTLSPDLTAAELTTVQNYKLPIGNGLSQTVQLERVDVYRLGEDRWLFAPPERDFWGVRRRLEGQLLSVRFPARDEVIVHRLAADLEAKLVQLCTTPGYNCPDEARVRLIFATEPEVLNQATFINALTTGRDAPPGAIFVGEESVRLPTPSLVGLPQDEIGYQALYRGYASLMLARAINDLTGWVCCNNVPFYRAAVTRQLYELGVAEWPLVHSKEAFSLPNNFNLGDAALHWHAPFPELSTEFAQTPAPYVVIDFLTNELKFSAPAIIEDLVRRKSFVFSEWIVGFVGAPWTEATLNNDFRNYVTQWQVEPAELAQPVADLLMLCHSTSQASLGLYHYDFSQDAPLLLEDYSYSQYSLTALPDFSGVAIAGQMPGQPDDGRVETYLWREGEKIEVEWNNVAGVTVRPPLAIPATLDTNGRYLLWMIAPAVSTGTYYGLTDLETCNSRGSCEVIPLGGYPIWSPGGERLLTNTVSNPWLNEGMSNGLLLLRDDLANEAINSPGFGSSPFWLDEEQFGYLTAYQNGAQQLLLSDIESGDPHTVLDNEMLNELLSEEFGSTRFSLLFARPLPTNPRIFVLLVVDLQSDGFGGQLLWYDQVLAQIVFLEAIPAGALLPTPPGIEFSGRGIRFSPNGRFLLITLPESEETGTQLILQDTISSKVFRHRLLGETALPRHFYASWSPDGEWLAMPELGYIRLWHNGRDEQLLTFDDLSCTNAVWVDKMEPRQ